MQEDENNEYPEQLDDVDFEKEKEEKKRLKAKKKLNKKIKSEKYEPGISDDESGQVLEDENKDDFKKIKKIVPKLAIGFIVLIAIIGVIIYIIWGNNGMGANKPASIIEDFCAYLNSGNIEKVCDTIDFKGYYIFYSNLEQKDYPKFESEYADFDENTEDYKAYQSDMEVCKNLDSEVFDVILEDTKLSVEEVSSVTKIQDTKDLYLVKVKLKVSSGTSAEEMTRTESIYVAKINGEYKLVYGYLNDVLLAVFQTAYQYSYYYGN